MNPAERDHLVPRRAVLFRIPTHSSVRAMAGVAGDVQAHVAAPWDAALAPIPALRLLHDGLLTGTVRGVAGLAFQ
jgi:hypothetical protein